MHHLRFAGTLPDVDNIELGHQYERLFEPGPSRITKPLPTRKKQPLRESKHWASGAPEQETVEIEKERGETTGHRKKGSQNVPIVPRQFKACPGCLPCRKSG